MRGILILMALAAMAIPAGAAGIADFDGTYTGTLTVKPGFDVAACPSHNIGALHVVKGQIQPGTDLPSFSGTIDPEGLVDGHMHRASGGDVAFEGSTVIGEYEAAPHLRATVVDTQTGCAWALDLLRQ